MKNNEQLLHTIGEINDKYISEKNIKIKSPIKWAAVGSAVCAAAIAGFIALRSISFGGIETNPNEANRWEDCRIFPVTDYNSGVVIEGTEEIYCGLLRHKMYGYVQERDYTQAEEIEAVLDPNNPWSGDMELASLPVFENLSYQSVTTANDTETPTRYLSDGTMLKMAENAAKQLGTEISESSFGEVGDESQGVQYRYMLKAVCGGEKYGLDALVIYVYSDGAVEIDFSDFALNGDNRSFTMPEEYSLSGGAEDEKTQLTLRYLAETFADLLQFEDYRYDAYTKQQLCFDDVMQNDMIYRISEKTDSDVRNILNYNLAFADFNGAENKLYRITLVNRLSVSEYLGEYPLISVDAARERLLRGAYVTNVYEGELKADELREEDIASAELVYRCDNNRYFLPFYRFYAELETPAFLEGTGLSLYGAFYVPAINFGYVNFGFVLPDLHNEIIPAYPADLVSLPDGTEISKTEALRAYGTEENPILEFDFGFMRYGDPVFDSTIDDPDCFNFDTETFNTDGSTFGEPKYFMVKAGDVLDNGLTVTKARFRITWENGQKYLVNDVEFNEDTGYVTYEGILRYFQEDGSLYFYPDPSGSVRVPLLYTDTGSENALISCVDGAVAFRTGGGTIYVGNAVENGNGFDAEKTFAESNCVKAKLNLKYIVFSDGIGTPSSAEAIFVGWEII
ncbi:MAG: hypothetical protein NC394_10375 [Bacteroides sp.]|nr:hypothetical protein [Bacteroides sp.]